VRVPFHSLTPRVRGVKAENELPSRAAGWLRDEMNHRTVKSVGKVFFRGWRMIFCSNDENEFLIDIYLMTTSAVERRFNALLDAFDAQLFLCHD